MANSLLQILEIQSQLVITFLQFCDFWNRSCWCIRWRVYLYLINYKFFQQNLMFIFYMWYMCADWKWNFHAKKCVEAKNHSWMTPYIWLLPDDVETSDESDKVAFWKHTTWFTLIDGYLFKRDFATPLFQYITKEELRRVMQESIKDYVIVDEPWTIKTICLENLISLYDISWPTRQSMKHIEDMLINVSYVTFLFLCFGDNKN